MSHSVFPERWILSVSGSQHHAVIKVQVPAQSGQIQETGPRNCQRQKGRSHQFAEFPRQFQLLPETPSACACRLSAQKQNVSSQWHCSAMLPPDQVAPHLCQK